MEEEIREEFIRSGFTLDDEEEILKKCLTFCINYNLKPCDLVSSWEVYYLNRQLAESTVQNDEMDGFLLHLQNEQKEAIIKEEPNLHIYSIKDVDMILNDEGEDYKEVIPSTPPADNSLEYNSDLFDSNIKSNGNGYSTGKPLNHVTPFGQRTDKFVVKFNINNLPDITVPENDHIDDNSEDDIVKRVQPNKKCSLVVHGSVPEPGCLFMYDRIEDRFNALDNRIKKHAAALLASGLYEEPTDPTVASQRNLFAVGMICCDGEGRLNDKSILLQSSVEHSGGQRVRLDTHNLSQFSIFPGQIVGVEGNNPSGHCLIASKLIDSVPLSPNPAVDLHPAKKQALDQEILLTDPSYINREISAAVKVNHVYRECNRVNDWLAGTAHVHPVGLTVLSAPPAGAAAILREDPIGVSFSRLLIASGPFTTVDNLIFEPLTELLAHARRKPPQLLILLGPFIDSEHPEIKKGTVKMSFDDIFRVEILGRLQDYVEYMGSDARVLLVPSIRDANHDYVFPQPAFEIQPPNLEHKITSLSNPGIFEANQVSVGCCTVDIIKQLSGEVMSRNPADGAVSDRMSRLASHLLNQRSFYPLYPPAEDVPLDSSLAPEALHIPSVPDILILPSNTKYFIKVVSIGGRSEGEEQMKCICINPGRLAKGEGGGTFVELNYCGSPDKMNASVIGI